MSNGHHSNGRHNNHTPTALELLQESQLLVADNHHRAAACIARQAINNGLIEATLAAECWPIHSGTGRRIKKTRNRLLPLLLANLEFEERIDAAFNDRVRRAIEYANRAAHGRPLPGSEAFAIVEVAAEVVALSKSIKPVTRPAAPVPTKQAATTWLDWFASKLRRARRKH